MKKTCLILVMFMLMSTMASSESPIYPNIGQDLTTLLGIWGTSDSMHDLNCDGIIDGGDLNILLGAWTD